LEFLTPFAPRQKQYSDDRAFGTRDISERAAPDSESSGESPAEPQPATKTEPARFVQPAQTLGNETAENSRVIKNGNRGKSMASMASVMGLVFANMHDSTITDLTKTRTTGSVPFGGRYRLIDFTLSNMANSGISAVGVITKANYQSLLGHLGAGAEWDLSRKNGGLSLLPPYGRQEGNWLYRGRLDALYTVYNYIRSNNAEYVVMTDCDVIANIDFKPIIDYHEQKDADITIVYGRKALTEEQSRSKTLLSINDEGQVYDALVHSARSGEYNASLNIFVMRREFLLNLIAETSSRNLYSFEVDVIQHKLRDYRIFGYKYAGYYEHIDSILTFFKANMELMNRDVRKTLFSTDRPIYTKVRDEAPAKYAIDANVRNTLVADGCVIEGTVENCVLFRGVNVGKGAFVRNSILMQNTVIGDKCDINYVITDKSVQIGSYRSLIGTVDYPVFVGKNAVV
jgi:glucose-1-phosphate adenylyltransferase